MKVEPRFDILHENAGKFVILLFLCCPICIVSADENFTAFRMKDIAGKSEETFENISQTFEERAGNVTEEAIVQPPRWQEWLDNSQIAISVIGLITNFGTFLTLAINGEEFAPCIRLLLKHQSLIDSFACLIAGLQVLQTPFWVAGVSGLDFIICVWWHGMAFYWGSLFVSISNLVLVAFERYICVCVPLKHNELSNRRLIICMVFMYFASVVANWGTPLVGTELVGGKCVGKLQRGNYYIAFAISAFSTFYALPSLALVILYGMVIYTLRIRIKETGSLGTSTVIEKASIQVTKAALIITIIFILTFSYNLWYFLLGTFGIFEFRIFNFHQALSQWGTSFNCFINPFVYIIVMPAFLRSVKRTFCFCCKHNFMASSVRNKLDESSVTAVTTVTED